MLISCFAAKTSQETHKKLLNVLRDLKKEKARMFAIYSKIIRKNCSKIHVCSHQQHKVKRRKPWGKTSVFNVAATSAKSIQCFLEVIFELMFIEVTKPKSEPC